MTAVSMSAGPPPSGFRIWAMIAISSTASSVAVRPSSAWSGQIAEDRNQGATCEQATGDSYGPPQHGDFLSHRMGGFCHPRRRYTSIISSS